MSQTDIVALIITFIGVASFAAVVTVLFRNYIKSSISEIKIGNRDIEIIDLMIYESDKKVIRKTKTNNAVKTIVYYAFLAIIIPIFGLSLYSRIKDNVTKIGDNMVMVVASGSMSTKNNANSYLVENNLNNQFQTYDLITLTSVKSNYDLKKYDVIAYRNDKRINVIHRIIDVQYIDGVVHYITRGDSNATSDSYKPTIDDVLGKYTGQRIPALGMFILFFQSYAGIITVLSVVYCSFMISYINKKLDATTEERKQLLSNTFELSSMRDGEVEFMNTTHTNTIFYKNFAYEMFSDGSTNKREMSAEEKEKYNGDGPVKVEASELVQEENIKENHENDGSVNL